MDSNPATATTDGTGDGAEQAPESSRIEWEYELRMPDGRLAGLHHVHALQTRLYTGGLETDCKVRRPAPGPAWPGPIDGSGEWLALWEVPELKRVLELLGLETGPPEGERRIARWQKSADTPETENTAHTVTRLELSAVEPAPAPRPSVLPLIIGTVALVLIMLVVGLIIAL